MVSPAQNDNIKEKLIKPKQLEHSNLSKNYHNIYAQQVGDSLAPLMKQNMTILAKPIYSRLVCL